MQKELALLVQVFLKHHLKKKQKQIYSVNRLSYVAD